MEEEVGHLAEAAEVPRAGHAAVTLRCGKVKIVTSNASSVKNENLMTASC